MLICQIQHQIAVNLWIKNYRLWLTNPPPLALFPSFIIYYNIYFNKNRYYQSHLSQCNLISVFIF
uniref:Uncharacterized protein n=1 Tax=Escherichia coli TaxID=562 RepID=C7BUI3_ECOLX|nr:hypothetical protein [Escherichia coli]